MPAYLMQESLMQDLDHSESGCHVVMPTSTIREHDTQVVSVHRERPLQHVQCVWRRQARSYLFPSAWVNHNDSWQQVQPVQVGTLPAVLCLVIHLHTTVDCDVSADAAQSPAQQGQAHNSCYLPATAQNWTLLRSAPWGWTRCRG